MSIFGHGLAFELLPTSNEAILQIDEQLKDL